MRGEQRVRVAGALEKFTLETPDAERLILNARVAAGWIEADPEEEEAPAYDDTEAEHGEHDGELAPVEEEQA